MNMCKLFSSLAVATIALIGASQAQAASIWNLSLKTTNGYEWCTDPTCQGNNPNSYSHGEVDIKGPNAPPNTRLAFAVGGFTGSYQQTSVGYKLGFTGLNIVHGNGSPGQVTLALTYNGLSASQIGQLTSSLSAQGSTLHGQANAITVSASVLVNGAMLSNAGSLGTLNLGQCPSCQTHGTLTNTAMLKAGGTYSLTMLVTVAFAAGSSGTSVLLNWSSVLVPEPNSILLLGMGLLVIGLAFRWRGRQLET